MRFVYKEYISRAELLVQQEKYCSQIIQAMSKPEHDVLLIIRKR